MLDSWPAKNAYVFNEFRKFHKHTTHRVARCATKIQQKITLKNIQNQSRTNQKHFNSTNHTESNQKCQMILIRTIFIYFISKQEWYMKDETGNK